MIAINDHAARAVSGTFFTDAGEMPRTRASSEMGRPKAIAVDADQFEAMAAALQHAVNFLKDTAKFMRENDLEKFTIPAAKMMDEHLPAVENFARRAFADVGPAVTSKRLGRKTNIEQNQTRHEKYGKVKRSKE